MSRVCVDIVVPVFSTAKFRNETMGNSMLKAPIRYRCEVGVHTTYLKALTRIISSTFQRDDVGGFRGWMEAIISECKEACASLNVCQVSNLRTQFSHTRVLTAFTSSCFASSLKWKRTVWVMLMVAVRGSWWIADSFKQHRRNAERFEIQRDPVNPLFTMNDIVVVEMCERRQSDVASEDETSRLLIVGHCRHKMNAYKRVPEQTYTHLHNKISYQNTRIKSTDFETF